MFGPEEFVEVPVIGLMLLLGMLPLLLGSHRLLKKGVRVRIASPIGGELSLPHLAALAVVVAFIVGLVGNQVIDAVVEDDIVPDVDRYEHMYKTWRRSVAEPKLAPTLKTAEFQLADNSEYARTYLRRHRAIIRVIRAAVAGLMLLLINMAVYELERRRTRQMVKRFTFLTFAAAILMLQLCLIGYVTEVSQISKRVLELTTLRAAK